MPPPRPVIRGVTKSSMRLARALAQMGFDSRRGSEQAILLGRVAVNGVVVAEVATVVDPQRDEIAVDGQVLGRPAKYEYYVLNKPVGVVSTVKDRHAEQTVVELIPSKARLYPVGRL